MMTKLQLWPVQRQFSVVVHFCVITVLREKGVKSVCVLSRRQRICLRHVCCGGVSVRWSLAFSNRATRRNWAIFSHVVGAFSSKTSGNPTAAGKRRLSLTEILDCEKIIVCVVIVLCCSPVWRRKCGGLKICAAAER